MSDQEQQTGAEGAQEKTTSAGERAIAYVAGVLEPSAVQGDGEAAEKRRGSLAKLRDASVAFLKELDAAFADSDPDQEAAQGAAFAGVQNAIHRARVVIVGFPHPNSDSDEAAAESE